MMLHADYPEEAVARLYENDPGLSQQPWDAQVRAYANGLIGIADFYSRNLVALGHDAHEIVINSYHSQRQWAREHGVPLSSEWELRMRRGWLPWVSRKPRTWDMAIVAEQIKYYQPDVLLNLVAAGASVDVIRACRSSC